VLRQPREGPGGLARPCRQCFGDLPWEIILPRPDGRSPRVFLTAPTALLSRRVPSPCVAGQVSAEAGIRAIANQTLAAKSGTTAQKPARPTNSEGFSIAIPHNFAIREARARMPPSQVRNEANDRYLLVQADGMALGLRARNTGRTHLTRTRTLTAGANPLSGITCIH
jgi:hypothetical protein